MSSVKALIEIDVSWTDDSWRSAVTTTSSICRPEALLASSAKAEVLKASEPVKRTVDPMRSAFTTLGIDRIILSLIRSIWSSDLRIVLASFLVSNSA